MDEKLKQYRGEKIDVIWDPNRCIHQAECTRRLGVVFDTGRKPWVLPDAASAEQVAATVLHCPTGALRFTRKDGGAPEAADPVNTISPGIDGPLFVRGDILIETPDGAEVLKDKRMALCRCGASKNKPFCDKSHLQTGFRHNGLLGENEVETEEGSSKTDFLKIVPSENGPLELYGSFEIWGPDQTSYKGNRAFLCRCGGSSNKPFCDNTHLRIGFKSK